MSRNPSLNLTRHTLALLAAFILGCGSSSPADNPDGGAGGEGDATTSRPDAGEQPVDCSQLAAIPIQPTVLTNFSGSEDFAFDSEGNLVSTDQSGNLTKQPKSGNRQVFVPGLGETAGTRFLANGDLVIASVEQGALLRIAPNGSVTTMLSGLQYPNGVEVGRDGFVYVAEHDAGQVRRVNPDNGEFTIVASGLTNPNGLAFSPDDKTLYVGSFGGGSVHSVSIDAAGNPGQAQLFGETPGASPGCDGQPEGTTCSGGFGEVGTCTSGGECQQISSPVPKELTEPCASASSGASCNVSILDVSYAGTCQQTAGQLACVAAQTCGSGSEGNACLEIDQQWGTYVGTCQPWDSELYCTPGGEGSTGGIDGVVVDACGNVYVTEYIVGYVWRFQPSGGEPELVFDADSSWIPNMHFGTGAGGWDEKTMYVMDREQGRVYALPIGVPGNPMVYP